MKITNVVMTTQGLALLAAATPQAPIPITQIQIGSAVIGPIPGTIYPGNSAAESIALVQASILLDIFVSRNVSGKHAIIRAAIQDYVGAFTIAQFGIWSNDTLIAIGALPAVVRPSNAGKQDFLIRMPADNLNKIVLNVNSVAVSSRAKVVTDNSTMQSEFNNLYPVGPKGGVLVGTAASKTVRKLVRLMSVVRTVDELNEEKLRVEALLPRPNGHWIVVTDALSRRIVELTAAGWVNVSTPSLAAYIEQLGYNQIIHDKYTKKTYYTTSQSETGLGLIRIFNAS